MSIGGKIRSRRIEMNMTQEDLAAKVGYTSKSTVNKIELGINDIPLSKVRDFARALETTESYLMGWEDVSSSSGSDQADVLFIEKYGQPVFDAAMIYSSLDELDRGKIDERMNVLLEDEKYQKRSHFTAKAI